MLTLARRLPVLRPHTILSSYARSQYYSNEAGPSYKTGAKTRKQKLRNTVASQVGKKSTTGMSFDELQNIMDGPLPKTILQSSPEPKAPRPPKELGSGVPRTGRRVTIKDDWDDWRDRKSTRPKHSYMLSKTIHKWIANHKSPLTERQIDEVEAIVTNALNESVNAAVYNLLFSVLGSEGKFQRMWKAYNTMKKRGVRPNSRTFTTLLNAYAHLAHSGISAGAFTPAHPPERMTIDRVRIIFEQSQAHIRDEMAKGEPAEDDGLARPDEDTEQPAKKVKESEISTSPTNAYLKFLARFGMWTEMERVFLAMDTTGPLSPDQVTYFTMLRTIVNIAQHNQKPVEGVSLPMLNAGSTGRMYWDRAVRSLSNTDSEDYRKVDEELALVALQCLSLGGSADHRLVEQLLPRLYNLPLPGQPASSSDSTPASSGLPATWTDLPTFKLSVHSATNILHSLKRMGHKSVTAYYTNLVLNDTRLQEGFDLHALRIIIQNLSEGHDADGALAVLDMYSPPTGKDGWPTDVWNSVLSAARWAADWETALSVFRRMVHLPIGIEVGKPPKPYTWSPPNGKPVDVRGRPWVKVPPQLADVKSIDLLLKTALAAQKSQGIKPLRQAVTIYRQYAHDLWNVMSNVVDQRGRPRKDEELNLLKDTRQDLTKTTRRAIAERCDLAEDLETAAERLMESPLGTEDEEQLIAMRKEAQQVQMNWKWVLDKLPAAVRREHIAARGFKPDPPRSRFRGETGPRTPRKPGERAWKWAPEGQGEDIKLRGGSLWKPDGKNGGRPRSEREGEDDTRPRRFGRGQYRPDQDRYGSRHFDERREQARPSKPRFGMRADEQS